MRIEVPCFLVNFNFMIFTGEISTISIDTYSFFPGPHTLFINYITTFGKRGVFQYQFEGQLRPSKYKIVYILITEVLTNYNY